jgi:uncharacterized membrane protein
MHWPLDIWRVIPVCALLWLAYMFGRTLTAGRIPLIERVARVRDLDLPAPLQRYTRRLTWLWTLYFVACALTAALSGLPAVQLSSGIWMATLIMFAGERIVRPLLFQGRSFPTLWQQVVDTAHVWRQRP